MKRVSAIVLSMALLLCGLSACNPAPAENESAQTAASADSAAQTTQEASSDAAGETPSAPSGVSPDESTASAQGSTPSPSSKPAQSGTSQDGSNPAQPGTSQEGSKPAQPGISQQSSTPAQPGTSQQSSQPAQTSTFQQSSQPVQTSTSQQSSKPAQTSTPQQSSKPAQTSTPQQSSKPVQTSTPQQSSQPVQISTPQQRSTPATEPQPSAGDTSIGDITVYNELFNIQNKLNVEITISQSELDKLQADYNKYQRMNSKSPIYRKADVVITIGSKRYEINEVGIRLKGNMSLSPIYDRNGKLNISHYKLSFNETFDDKTYYGSEAKVWASKEERKARKNRRFATLKKLDVKWNSVNDDTHIREYYAAEMFRQSGVLVQRQNLSQVTFNGKNYGLLKIYEPVDEIFLEKNLPQAALGGDLYKCGWTMKPCNYVKNEVTYGVEDKDRGTKYNFNLKTNEKTSNHASLKNLLNVLSSNPTQAQFEQVVDTDYLAKFLAASYFAGDPDDMRNNYNNHYVYFRKDNGKAIFIVYDNDRTLGITDGFNPDGAGMTSQSPYSMKAAGARQNQNNPLIKLAILTKGYCKTQYAAELKKVASLSLWSNDSFNRIYETARSHYESIVRPAVNFANADETFRFSLDGVFGSDRKNMCFSDYLTRIFKAYNK